MAIELDALRIVAVVAAAYLPQAGDAGAAARIVVERGAVALDLVLHDRPRADDAHLAGDHVEQLRQLVEAGHAQELADLGDARILAELVVTLPFRAQMRLRREELVQRRLGVENHRAELPAAERPAVRADAAVAEQRRPAVAAHANRD